MNLKTVLGSAFLLFTMMLSAAFGAEQSLRVEGAPQPLSLTAAQVKEKFASEIKHIEFTSRGAKHEANGVPLLALLKSAGVPTEIKMDPKADAKTKNLPLRYVIVVVARDGYTAAFSLAELLPSVGNREVWLAVDIDGQPLLEQDAPKLLVPGDQKPIRQVRGIDFIRVIDASTAK